MICRRTVTFNRLPETAATRSATYSTVARRVLNTLGAETFSS